jgi:hypothetical protein
MADAWQHFATAIMAVTASTSRRRFHLHTLQKHNITSPLVFSAKFTLGIPMVRTKNSKLTQKNDTLRSNAANIYIGKF